VSWGDVARTGDWEHWQGLPEGLDEAALASELRLPPGPARRATAMLGSQRVEMAESGGVRYWLRGTEVILVELRGPASAASPAELLEALGAPDREGPGRFRRADALTTEYVYAGRGLAITVAESYDDPPSFAPEVGQVLLFAPTDLRGFVVDLGGNDRGGPRL
jgi:hypothetical protein